MQVRLVRNAFVGQPVLLGSFRRSSTTYLTYSNLVGEYLLGFGLGLVEM
jgi:hypothetical protein